MEITKRERANALFEHYGKLLTQKEQHVFSSYYLYDLSLAEIAEQENVSRAAISDSLNKALKKLEVFEEKLGLCLKCDKALKKLQKAEKIEDYKEIVEELIDGI